MPSISIKSSAAIIAVLTVCLCADLTFAEYRTYDGTDNNQAHPTWGATGTDFQRIAAPAYDDGISSPRGFTDPTIPNARVISNTIIAQPTMLPNTHQMTNWVFQWGQFIDHDVTLTPPASPVESFDIQIPMGDPMFDAGNTGTQTMEFQRSAYDPATGTGPGNPRQQINANTSYIDASQVYGSDETRARTLRTLSGGKMKTSAGNLLPLNTLGLSNATGGPGDPAQFYVAGDERVNEQVGLTSVHTLFLREHNRLADEIATANPSWTDEQIYQRARKLVGGEIQAITYNEFLPALLGSHAPTIQSTYNENVNATVLTEFSTALYRVGHTMLSPQLMRMQNDGTEALGGSMSLRDAFFRPQNLASPNELEYFLKGLASAEQQDVDMHVVDDVRNFLFGDPIPGGFDLASLNIQRGRDHGLPDYNSLRVAFGLPAVTSFAEITSDPTMQAGLQSLYGDVNRIDAWVGALSEDHLAGASVGPLIVAGLSTQFTMFRDGDRFWFTRDADLSVDDILWLSSIQLSDVIRANTSITNIQDQVFFMAVPEPSSVVLVSLLLVGGITRRRGR